MNQMKWKDGATRIGNKGLESKEQYLAAQGVSRSYLKFLDESFERMIAEMNKSEEEKKDSVAMLQGRSIHELIMEPEKINDYVLDNEMFDSIDSARPRSTNKYRVWKSEMQLAGKEVLKWDTEGIFITEAKAVLKSVYGNDTLSKILKASEKEFAMAAEINGILAKCCADILLDGQDVAVIYDLKSIDGIITQSELENYAARYGLHLQAAWYSKIARIVLGKRVRFGIIFIGKNRPYPIKIQMVSDEAMELGIKEVDYYIDKIKMGLEGKWSFDRQCTDNVLQLPDWYCTKIESKVGGF